MNKIEDQNLEEIELILAQSLKGFHHLFDNNTIARVLRTPTEEMDFFTFENMDRIQALFSELIAKKGLSEKQDFLNRLDQESHEILLRTYFHIVENTLLSSGDLKHWSPNADERRVNSSILFLLAHLFLLSPTSVQAEYRAFELLITNNETGNERRVISTLDPEQYAGYYPVKKNETIVYTDTWRCWGNFSYYKKICPRPERVPTAAQRTGTATP